MAKNSYMRYDDSDTERLRKMIPGVDGGGSLSFRLGEIKNTDLRYRQRYDWVERVAFILDCTFDEAGQIYVFMDAARTGKYPKIERRRMFPNARPKWKREFLLYVTERFVKSSEEYPEF